MYNVLFSMFMYKEPNRSENDTFLNVNYFDVHVQCTFFLFVIQIQAMVMNWPFINKYVICSEELIT